MFSEKDDVSGGIPGEVHLLVETDPEAVARRGAGLFVNAALEAVFKRGCFRVALSGGSTPRPMHRKLAEPWFAASIPWESTSLFWVDERCVPPQHRASNYGAAKMDFLDRLPLKPGTCRPMPGGMPPETGAILYHDSLREAFGVVEPDLPVFDMIFLGMGEDGHTASLFPGQTSLEETSRWVVAVKGGTPDVDRLSMTLPVINHARHVCVMVTGQEKRESVRRVFSEPDLDWPVQRVRPTRGRLTWLLDRAAASFICKDQSGPSGQAAFQGWSRDRREG